MGLSGLARSEGARSEKDSRVKDIKREVREREREIGSPFLFPLWAMGRAVWIAMLIGSWKYEEITQNPLDFLTPTWVGPQRFSKASCYSWRLKVACLSALGWTGILSCERNSPAQSRFSSLWVTVTIGGLSINYHLNACRDGEGLFEGGEWKIRVLPPLWRSGPDLWREVSKLARLLLHGRVASS